MRTLIRSLVVLAVVLISILSIVMADGTDHSNVDFAVTERRLKAADANDLVRPGASQGVDDLTLAVPRRNHTSTTLTDGRVIFIGGESQNNNMVSEAEILDPVVHSITVAAGTLTARANHTATLLPDGKVLVAGGSSQKARSDQRKYSTRLRTLLLPVPIFNAPASVIPRPFSRMAGY